MLRTRSRIRLASLLTAGLLLALTAGSVQAAKLPKSFDATFCFAATNGLDPEDPEYLPDRIVVDFTWSGYAVDTISLGSGNGEVGFGFVERLDSVMRSGDLERWIGADNQNTATSAVIQIHDHVLAQDTVIRFVSWSELGPC
jgi:hypothetical protein